MLVPSISVNIASVFCPSPPIANIGLPPPACGSFIYFVPFLSINTEEENSDFAHLIANKAKIITGNGSFIQNIENGKVIETEEAATEEPAL